MGDVSGGTQTVLVTVFLNSHVPWEELVNQRAVTAAVACGVSQGEDRAIQKFIDMLANSDTDDSVCFKEKANYRM